jgi:hypothetical protein
MTLENLIAALEAFAEVSIRTTFHDDVLFEGIAVGNKSQWVEYAQRRVNLIKHRNGVYVIYV